ncbi:MAG: hypothetical protein JW940_08220 [Polyangiaceae bacterium]|nr:hypothetical protein [Polyangiaceae bacterium]
MATPDAAAKKLETTMQAELEEELRQAERDFVRGDFVDVTVEELDRCIAAGAWPWSDASSE